MDCSLVSCGMLAKLGEAVIVLTTVGGNIKARCSENSSKALSEDTVELLTGTQECHNMNLQDIAPHFLACSHARKGGVPAISCRGIRKDSTISSLSALQLSPPDLAHMSQSTAVNTLHAPRLHFAHILSGPSRHRNSTTHRSHKKRKQ
jgi:hypothetical protein